MNYLGVDPGISGALVVVDGLGQYVDHLLMPTTKPGKSNRVNAAAVAAFVNQHAPRHAFIEKVGAMPGDGVRRMGASSAFSFGVSAGMVEGIIAGAGIPITLVAPQSWKKWAGLIGSEKDAARSRAIQLYPTLRALDTKAKGQAIADALLIALYGVHALDSAGSLL